MNLSRRDLFAAACPRPTRASRGDSLPDRPDGAPGRDAAAHPGVATIRVLDCVAGPPSFCLACAERCPVPGAIVVRDHRPRIEASACDGCGICQDICPAPRNAILLMPRRSAP